MPKTPSDTRPACNRSGVLSSTTRISPLGCTSFMPTMDEARLPNVRPVPWVPVVSAPAIDWLSMSPWLTMDNPAARRALPKALMVVPAAAVTRFFSWSIWRTPLMLARVRCRPLVSATGVKECPEPATRTFMPLLLAWLTIEHSSSSLAGAPRAVRMQDWLPAQLRQCACSRPNSLICMLLEEVLTSFSCRLFL
ncbi:hypothetical protein D3C80_1447650 [compost metagenome]